LDFDTEKNVTKFSEKSWKLSSVKQSAYHFSLASGACAALQPRFSALEIH